MTNWKIPLFIPDITGADIQAATEPIRDNWLTMGDKTRQFEEEFAHRIGAQYAVAVCNGTAALHLALSALRIQPGDEVLLPSLTFVACANVIEALGAKPVFVDLHSEEDWTISPEDLERKLTEKTRAILAVHYAGFPCHMDDLLAIATKYNLSVVEDSAHALFSYQKGKACGTLGDIGCFSFFSNKNMTTGEGGMVITQNESLAERIRLMRSHGMTTLTLDRHRGHAFSYDVMEYGYNYRIDEIRSALGYSQLQRLESNGNRRKEIYRLYLEQLQEMGEIQIPFLNRTEDIGYHIFPILLKDPNRRESFMQGMKKDGIQTSIHYPPIHWFSVYSEFRDSANCPMTEKISNGEVTLPFYPGMSDDEVITVCEAVKRNIVISRQ